MTSRHPILTIPRMYSDENGRTHIEDILIDGGEKHSEVSHLFAVFGDWVSAERLQFRRVIEEDDSPGLHNAPARQLSVQLSGTSEFEAGDGSVCRLEPGQMILLDDLTGEGHRSRNAGKVPRISLHIRVADMTRSEK